MHASGIVSVRERRKILLHRKRLDVLRAVRVRLPARILLPTIRMHDKRLHTARDEMRELSALLLHKQRPLDVVLAMPERLLSR